MLQSAAALRAEMAESKLRMTTPTTRNPNRRPHGPLAAALVDSGEIALKS